MKKHVTTTSQVPAIKNKSIKKVNAVLLHNYITEVLVQKGLHSFLKGRNKFQLSQKLHIKMFEYT